MSRLHWTRIDRQADLPMVGERRLFRHVNGYIFYGRVEDRFHIRSLDKWKPGKFDWWCFDSWADDGSEDREEAERRRLEKIHDGR